MADTRRHPAAPTPAAPPALTAMLFTMTMKHHLIWSYSLSGRPKEEQKETAKFKHDIKFFSAAILLRRSMFAYHLNILDASTLS